MMRISIIKDSSVFNSKVKAIPLFLACLLIALISSARPGDRSEQDERLFGLDRITTIQLQIGPSEIQKLTKDPLTYVPADARIDGETFADASLHLKGHGSFRPISEKPNFSLKLGKSQTKERGYSHKRLLLNNSSQDSALIRAKLASELALKAGLPAARVNFARVQLNGRDLGLYLLVEPMDKVFLARHFRSASGNLYEGSNQDVTDKLEVDSGKSDGDQADLRKLAAACQETNLTRRWERFRAVLDVDRFATFMALEVLICHHDGYSLDRNNFRIYHDPATDRMVFLPHGMDLIFNRADAPLTPSWRGMVAGAMMETVEGRRLYYRRVREVAQQCFETESLKTRIDALARFLREHLTAPEDARQCQALDVSIQDLKQTLLKRSQFVLTQLDTLPTE